MAAPSSIEGLVSREAGTIITTPDVRRELDTVLDFVSTQEQSERLTFVTLIMDHAPYSVQKRIKASTILPKNVPGTHDVYIKIENGVVTNIEVREHPRTLFGNLLCTGTCFRFRGEGTPENIDAMETIVDLERIDEKFVMNEFMFTTTEEEEEVSETTELDVQETPSPES